MQNETRTFRDLEIWHLGIALVKKVYLIELPASELYNLTSQIRRSAISVPSNIAEGQRRKSAIDFRRFLNITLGSLAELETQIIIAKELGYIREDRHNDLLKHIDLISRKVSTLHNRLNTYPKTHIPSPTTHS